MLLEEEYFPGEGSWGIMAKVKSWAGSSGGVGSWRVMAEDKSGAGSCRPSMLPEVLVGFVPKLSLVSNFADV